MASEGSLKLEGCCLHQLETLPGLVSYPGSLNPVDCVVLAQPLRPLLPEQGHFSTKVEKLLHVQLQLKPVLVGQTALEARLDWGGYCLHQQEVAPAEPGSPAGLNLDCCCPQALQPLMAQVASQGCLGGNSCACDQLGGISHEAGKP